MKRFNVAKSSINDLRVIHRQPISDERGYLERVFCSDELKSVIGQRNVMQINHTLTGKAGTVRGMHFQHPPYAEMKLVSCLRGEVFDVSIDLRNGSPTFLHWHGEILSEKNHRTVCIPEGFAHGFQSLTDNCELLYLHTTTYSPDAEAGLNALDARLAIKWPMPITERSLRDKQHTMLTSEFEGLFL